MSIKPSIGFQLSWIARMLRTRFDARARQSGLTRAQWTMIAAIRYAEGATQSEIASRLEINTVTAGRIVDRLQAAGWVERRPDPIDRRVNRLYITAGAGPVIDTMGELGAEEEAVTLTGFSADEQAVLHGLLARITENLTGAPLPALAADACRQVDAQPDHAILE